MNERTAALDAIRAVVGRKGWLDGPEEIEPYVIEQRGLYRGHCAMVVRPASTAEVAMVVSICRDAGLPVFPQGGNTGLCGGGVPEGGIVLSTARLDRVRAVDALNHTMTAEAGVVLADVQGAAAEAGCLFPLSLGAEGSCRIGGNLSTNAGGNAVLRYGNARDLVLGLEVVLPDGRVWEGLRGLRKDNTGYDLKHLFIGAEGTLGVITAAVLKLFPPPRQRATALAAAPSVEAVLELFRRTRAALADNLTGFELMSRLSVELVLKHVPGANDPFRRAHAQYALIEVTSPSDDGRLGEALERVLGRALEEGAIADAAVAASEGQAEALWRLRDTLPEAQSREGGSIKHDVSVPVSRVAEFIARADAAVEREMAGVRVVAFGHVGDGNVHFNLSQPEAMAREAFLREWARFNRIVHDIAVSMDGSFSAEHGIGQLRRDDLRRYRSAVELDLMRTLKKALDPKNIMNPGKVVDLD
jgi:D-lactate dehydrogenase (cytochrome)